MKRTIAMLLVLSSVLLIPMIGYAEISCTRGGLQDAVDLYIEAQTKGDLSILPLANGVGYMENMAPANINEGLVSKALKYAITSA